MASRTDFEGSTDVGVFANLTNAYCITGLGASANFYRCADSLHMIMRWGRVGQPRSRMHAMCAALQPWLWRSRLRAVA